MILPRIGSIDEMPRHQNETGSGCFDYVLTAALTGNSEILATLKKSGDLDALNYQGLSAVLHVVIQNRLDVLQLLVDAGADVDAHDPKRSAGVIDQTAFLLAGATGNNVALRILIKSGAQPDIYNGYRGTALIPAAEKGHFDTVKLLLEETSIDVNHVNRLGWTALMEAVILADGGIIHQKIVHILLSHGADASIADLDGVTPLQHALSKGYVEMANMLQDQTS